MQTEYRNADIIILIRINLVFDFKTRIQKRFSS